MVNRKIIESLKWDSDFFGMKIGRIQLAEGSFTKARFIEEQNKGQFDLIYGFSGTSQNPNGFWESLGFYLADSLIILSMQFNPEKYKNSDYAPCAKLSKEDITACYEIAEMTACVSRFYREPVIGHSLAKKLYRKWVDTALDGTFSDCLFVERIKGKIAGIHTIKTENNAGVFTLTGVRNDLLGRHIGRKLWDQSFAYWANSGQKIISVHSKFSIRNLQSLGFHIAMGFTKVEQTSYIYHYSRKKIQA